MNDVLQYPIELNNGRIHSHGPGMICDHYAIYFRNLWTSDLFVICGPWWLTVLFVLHNISGAL